jgi:glycerol-3-phosphate O-acyltransferase
MALFSKSLTAISALTGEPLPVTRPWVNWIALQSRRSWVLPHARRRFDAVAHQNITVYTSPVFPVWLTRLLRERFLNEGWPAPRYLLTTGSILRRHSGTFRSIRNESVLFLELGITLKHARASKEWIRQILEDSAIQNRTLQFIPLIFLWNRSPDRKFFYPLYGFIRHKHHNLISTGSPLTIQPGITKEIPSVQAVRRNMLAAWNQESRVIIGDKKIPLRKTIRLIQSEPVLLHLLKGMAAQGKDTLATLQSRVSAYVREIAADYSYISPWLWEKVLGSFLRKNFSSLDFDHDGLDELRMLLRKREIVILTPTHRSHLDYIFISYAIYKQGLACPLVAAGQNLSFWPMGYIFRRTGAFFIRRTFRGLDIYPHVFRSYLWLILRRFQPVEFFIEGGRSRTGSLLPAKLGMLNMIIEAFNSGKLNDVKFVPLAVNYDRILEEDSYIRELKGLPKQKERISSLLKNRHLLKRHFGNVCFAIGKPVSLAETLSETTTQAEQKDTLGMTIMNQLRLTMPVTSTALVAAVLMAADPDHGISAGDIHIQARDLLLLITEIHPGAAIARECSDISRLDYVFQSAVDRMMEFQNIVPGTKEGVWKLNVIRRFQVDYLRNSIMGLLLAPALAVIRNDTDWNSPENARILAVFCPGIHPMPTSVLQQEIRTCVTLLPEWPHARKTMLEQTLSPLWVLVQNIKAILVSEHIDLRNTTSRSWNKIFHRAIDENRSRKFPEICSKSFVTELFKAFRQSGNEPAGNTDP